MDFCVYERYYSASHPGNGMPRHGARAALLVSTGDCLIIGDAGYEDFYELDRQYDKGRLAAFLEKLKGRDETWLVAGHEKPLPLKDFITYLEGIYHEL